MWGNFLIKGKYAWNGENIDSILAIYMRVFYFSLHINRVKIIQKLKGKRISMEELKIKYDKESHKVSQIKLKFDDLSFKIASFYKVREESCSIKRVIKVKSLKFDANVWDIIFQGKDENTGIKCELKLSDFRNGEDYIGFKKIDDFESAVCGIAKMAALIQADPNIKMEVKYFLSNEISERKEFLIMHFPFDYFTDAPSNEKLELFRKYDETYNQMLMHESENENLLSGPFDDYDDPWR